MRIKKLVLLAKLVGVGIELVKNLCYFFKFIQRLFPPLKMIVMALLRFWTFCANTWVYGILLSHYLNLSIAVTNNYIREAKYRRLSQSRFKF